MKTYPEIRALLCRNADVCINDDGAFDPPLWLTTEAMHMLARLDPDFYENAINADSRVEQLLIALAVNDRVQTVMDLRALLRSLMGNHAAEHCREYAGDVVAYRAMAVDADD